MAEFRLKTKIKSWCLTTKQLTVFLLTLPKSLAALNRLLFRVSRKHFMNGYSRMCFACLNVAHHWPCLAKTPEFTWGTPRGFFRVHMRQRNWKQCYYCWTLLDTQMSQSLVSYLSARFVFWKAEPLWIFQLLTSIQAKTAFVETRCKCAAPVKPASVPGSLQQKPSSRQTSSSSNCLRSGFRARLECQTLLKPSNQYFL